MKHHPLKFAALALLVAAGSAFAAIDPTLMALVPSDAQILMGIQVDQSQSSPFGQFVLSQAGSNAGLDQFITATGFDPRRDLKQLLATSAGPNAGGLIIGRGIFQTDKLATAAALAGAVKSTYSGIDLYASKDNKNNTLAFLNSSTVLIGEPALLRGAIDQYRSGASSNNSLGIRANDLSNQYQAWFVTSSVAALNNLPAAGGQIPPGALQSILQVAGGLKLGADAVSVALEAATRTDKDAQALVDVARFFASMVQMNRNNDANAARAAAIVDTASITASGTVMKMSIAVPEKDLEALVGPQSKAQVRPGVAPRRK
jgi:hypothetical protein